MKISVQESGKACSFGSSPSAKILPSERPRKIGSINNAASAILSPLEKGMSVAEAALSSIPDTRDEIVKDLKDRINSGEYKVNGSEVAEMMIRRLKADRIR